MPGHRGTAAPDRQQRWRRTLGSAGQGAYGFNAATEEYGDMLEMGILDPTKVTRSALQNAAAVADLVLTTEAMVAELPKKEIPPPMPAGGMGDY